MTPHRKNRPNTARLETNKNFVRENYIEHNKKPFGTKLEKTCFNGQNHTSLNFEHVTIRTYG